MTKALIVYGTRYGATASTAQDIADVFNQEGLDVKLVNAKQEKIKDISDYDLVVVGSGIKIKKWTKEPEQFLDRFQKELRNKKLAIYVCCGAAHPLTETEKTAQEAEEAKQNYLVEKAAKYNLQPVAMGFFGGVYNFNNMGWFFKKSMSAVIPQLEAAGIKETEPGLYDTRDITAIRDWAKEVADLVQS